MQDLSRSEEIVRRMPWTATADRPTESLLTSEDGLWPMVSGDMRPAPSVASLLGVTTVFLSPLCRLRSAE